MKTVSDRFDFGLNLIPGLLLIPSLISFVSFLMFRVLFWSGSLLSVLVVYVVP